MKLDALDHPKTLDLAGRLEVSLPTAIGHLELLWAFTGKYAPAGDIGRHADGAIARACHWMGRPELFTLALREAGFFDADPEHRLTIHDWADHAPRWVKSKLKTLGLTFVSGHQPDTGGDAEGDTSPDTGGDSKGSEVKPSEGKSKGTLRAPDADRFAEGLDVVAWTRWLDYRVKIRKPLKPVSYPAAQAELAKYGADQAAVVEQAIAQGWQGLYALKNVPHGTSKSQQRQNSTVAAGLAFLAGGQP